MSRGTLLYFSALALILGAVFGSFLNCAAWRIAHGESFLRGHSRCPSCNHPLGVRDLVPVFSWLFQKGRCRYCGVKISVRYPLTELFFALVTLLCLLRFDLTILCLRNWIFLCCLFCLSLVDLESYIIPDGCLITAAAAWVLALPFLRPGWTEILRAVLAGLVFGGGILLLSLVMDKILKKESLGGGDVKLFAVVGLYLGFVGTLFSMLLSCVLGLVFVVLMNRRGEKGRPIPFGPSISLAAGFMLLYGDGLVRWYLGLLKP
jgi:leader peptidase (prepilin peptidase)/N-methyltransferase